MRMLVVGAGATGGYFGGRLAQAGRDVTFLVRPARAAQLRAGGLRLVSPHGDATITPQLLSADAIDGPYDAVLLAVKAYTLDQAIPDVAPAIGPETMIVPMLNGMRHIDLLKERFGAGPVLGGVCRVATEIDGEGRIVQLQPFQDLSYGELDGSESPRTAALDAFMQGAGFGTRLSRIITREMWEKWILLAAMGAVCGLMRGTIGEIEAAPGGTAFVAAMLDEILGIVAAVGEMPREPVLAYARGMLNEKGSRQAPSMYRDLSRGNPIEADQIVGDLIARGRAAGIAAPLLSAAYANLCIYQARRAS